MNIRSQRRFVSCLAGLVAASSLAAAKPIEFDFKDPKGVNCMSFVLDSMLEPIMGLASGITGKVTFDPDKPEAAAGKIVVDAKSLHIENQGMEKTLHGGDWLNVSSNPEITFTFKKIDNVKKEAGKPVHMTVTGDFSVKGKSKEMAIPVQATYIQGGAANRMSKAKGDLLVLRANFVLKRSDFGIKSDMKADVVADDIEVRVSIVGAALEK
jgi:polyisoprenoid-binding protein YceI